MRIRTPPSRRTLAAVLAAASVVTSLGITTVAAEPTSASDRHRYQATIQRTTDGVPHITGRDLGSTIFGQGYASAQDHLCSLADEVLKLKGERARWQGPGTDNVNVASDFAWRQIGIDALARRDYKKAPQGVKTLMRAFVAGWNRYLAKTGAANVTGYCRGQAWVKPITDADLYAYARSVALNASSGALAQYLGKAHPPAGAQPLTAQGASLRTLPAPPQIASNGWAIGSKRSASGGGMLLANPHFPWEGELRFWEVHLRVPGKIDTYGAQLIGLPGIGIGFTRGVAWTHTVSAGNRFTAYTLDLAPGKPTTYLYDGKERAMTSRAETVKVLQPDGSLKHEQRTMWFSHYGPILDFPGVGWSDKLTVTFRDANINDDEFLPQYLGMDQARSLTELKAVHRKHQGVPLFNTIAVGRDGRAWYADTSATPNLSKAALGAYEASLKTNALAVGAAQAGAILLDGSKSVNEWVNERGARDPGLIPYKRMPMTERRDYVFNANDSFWLPNADHLLTGAFSPLQGRQRTARSVRTRENATVLRDTAARGPAGADGKFTLAELRAAALLDRGYTSRTLREAVVARCRNAPPVSVPVLTGSDGSVALPAATIDVRAACDVLDAWDGTYDVGSRGAPVWREFISRFESSAFADAGPLWATNFDAAKPVDTPGGLAAAPATGADPVLVNLARAVQIIRKTGFPLDATLGQLQYANRTEEQIPVPGGTGLDGTTNVVGYGRSSSTSEPLPPRGTTFAPRSSLTATGYPINNGTSFLMAVEFTKAGPRAYVILTYGETGDRTSPRFTVQTKRFSAKDWRKVAYTKQQIARDPDLTTLKVSG